ncbi:mitochondrial outer membrane protein SLC25A46-like isoform X1 [Haliotis rufescens]|uniref:mitochondrial outer membrane protein SLC25A46-like isoform X1 n=1 Tax=Haliotis rufescens TaxID=6454 RepID=UPI00201EF642|nr:mitochondrial outer membrane protein SLC25A46-like isoform X1 [Haliotis rufescens]
MGTHIMTDRPFSSPSNAASRDRRRGYEDEDTDERDAGESVKTQIDQIQKFAGFSIGLSSIFAEQVLAHPCIVLRRQCQVHHNGEWYHVTPFTLFQVLINLQRHQGMTTMWKGIGSVFVVRGIFMVSETVISELTPFPKEISRHSSLKKYGEHLLLKALSTVVTTPFFAASLIETIQSDIASEKPGILDSVKEGLTRVFGWGMPQTTRLLPVWRLILPTVAYQLSHYVITSLAQFTVTSTIRSEQQELRDHSVDVGDTGRSVYEIYFPDLLATFTGSLLADLMLYPLETVLHRMYVQGTRTIIDNTDIGIGVLPISTGYEGFVDCFKCILLEEGPFGFYKGFGALVLQYALHAAILKMAKYLFEKLSHELSPRRRHQTPQRMSSYEAPYTLYGQRRYTRATSKYQP